MTGGARPFKTLKVIGGTASGHDAIRLVAEKLQALYFTFAAEISRNLPVWKHLTRSSIQHVFGHIGFA
jgi:hypothetical protein